MSAETIMWVSVQERLPDDDTTVLVYGASVGAGVGEPVWLAYLGKDGWTAVGGEMYYEGSVLIT